ncbi:MAG: YihY family inner membrane protein [Alphaproteobacteria bacterium]|nr:YihY family inner membrane protein [Alphaproteobacteria bacterium]
MWRRSRFTGIMADIGNFASYGFRRFLKDRMSQAAGALTYTTLLALVPLMAIAFSIFSAFPAFDSIQDRLQEMIFENLVPEVGQDVRGYITSFTANASKLTAVGIVALGVSAVLLLSTIESTLNTVWRVERQRPILIRLLIFWSVLTFGPLLLGASFSLTSDVFTSAREWAGESYAYVPSDNGGLWGMLQSPVAALLQSIAFTALFYIVPARSVHIRDAAIGGAISGIAFELLKWGFKSYLVAFPTYQTIYGAVAVFPIFLIWLYLSWTVIIFGAVFAAAFPEWWRSRDPLVGITLSPARKLEAAVALLAVLGKQAQSGGAVSQDELAAAVPLDARDGIVETLRGKGYLVTTDEDRVAVARDLSSATVADLARDLDLSLGLNGKDLIPDADEDEQVDPEDLSGLDSASGQLPEILSKLHEAEGKILGQTIAEVIADPRIPTPPSGQIVSFVPGHKSDAD